MAAIGPYWRTVALLFASNVFMTFAWYGHLKARSLGLVAAIAMSWIIALPEYCLQVPANRLGYTKMDGYQLKILQECITLVVFVGFATFFLREPLQPKYLVSFSLIAAAVWVAFR